MFVRPWDFSLLRRYDSPEGEGGGTGATGPAGPGATGPTGATGSGFTMTPEIEAEINRRAAAARKEGQTAAEATIAAAKKKADDDAELERQVKAGEFDTAKATLEKERDGFKTERDDFKAKYDEALKTITPGVTAAWKDLPVEVTKMFRGADDDMLAKHAFIADTADLVKTLTATTATGTRVPLTPPPADLKNGPSIEQTRKELAAARGVRR